MNDNKTLIELEFDGLPPTVNQMYRNVTRGGFTCRYKTPACHDFQDMLSTKIKRLWAKQPPYDGRVALFIKFLQHDHRRWDIDNRVKALQDCLQLAGVVKDDSQLDFLQVERVFNQSKTETKVKLMAIER